MPMKTSVTMSERSRSMPASSIDDNSPKDGTANAQELAADILGVDLDFDLNTRSGYVVSLLGNYYEYCEGVHGRLFSIVMSFGQPVVLCYDEDNGKVWLELDRPSRRGYENTKSRSQHSCLGCSSL